MTVFNSELSQKAMKRIAIIDAATETMRSFKVRTRFRQFVVIYSNDQRKNARYMLARDQAKIRNVILGTTGDISHDLK